MDKVVCCYCKAPHGSKHWYPGFNICLECYAETANPAEEADNG